MERRCEMKTAVFFLFATALAHGQWVIGQRSFYPSGSASTSVVFDSAVTPCEQTAASGTTVSCTLTGVTAGDTLLCGAAGGDGGQNYKFSDATNGLWQALSYGYSDGSYHVWVGIWGFPNSAAGSIVITATNTSSNGQGIDCWAVKNTRTTAFLDKAAFYDSGVPTTYSTAALASSFTPTHSGELIADVISTGNSADTLTHGANFTAISPTDTADHLGMEYWAQSSSTSTTCPWAGISPADTYGLDCIALLPSSASAGLTPYQDLVITFAGIGAAVPTIATLITSASGGPGNGWAAGEIDNGPGLQGYCAVNSYIWCLQPSSETTLVGTTAGPSTLLNTPLYLPAQQTLYTGNSAYNLQFTTGTPGVTLGYGILPTQTTLAFGGYIEFNIPQTDTSGHTYYPIGFWAGSSTDVVALELVASGSAISAQMYTTGNSNVTLANMSTSTVYWVTGQYSPGGTDKMAFYSGCPSACTQVASGTKTDTVSSSTYQTLFMGSYNLGTQASGDDIWFRNVEMCASYPCLP